MIEILRSVRAHRATTATLACACFVAVSIPAAAQTTVPATACDAALANPDLHPQPDMPLENGTIAFTYGPSFVSGGASSMTITVNLTFQPGPDTTIRLSALDETCTGGSRAGTVFTYTFGELTSTQNTVTYDATAGEVSLNGTLQKTTPQGTPRYLFFDVWDGELPSTHATHSYLIDLLNPANPTTPQ
jgi:hypothetical protein